MIASPNDPPVRFPRLRALVARHRCDAAMNLGGPMADLTDADRTKALAALAALAARAKSGCLSPDDEPRIRALQALVEKHKLAQPGQAKAAA